MAGVRDLSALFDPRSIAVVGASRDAAKWGGDVAARLVRTAGDRPVFLVNRRGGEIHGRTAFTSLRELPESPEMVIMAIPSAAFEAALDDALTVGARAVVSIFAGLGETGDEGKERERAAAERVRAAGALMIGPNCMGVADTSAGFQAVAYLDIPAGGLAFVSQSGGMGEELVTRMREYGIGFSRYVTLGNQADVGVAEVLRSLVDHAATRVVALYVEDLREGREFARAAAEVVAAGTPVLLLAPGRSAASVRAARSHTGSLAPDSAVVDAVCRATGIVRVDTSAELFEAAVGFLAGCRPRGRRLAVISDGGGHGGIAADAAVAAGLEVSALSDGLVARVREALPVSVNTNPIDFAIGTIEPDAYARVVETLAGSDEIDAMLAAGQLGYWGARFLAFSGLVAVETEGARRIAAAARTSDMPLVVCTAYPECPAAAVLREEGVPVYRDAGAAVRVLARMVAAAMTEPGGVPALPEGWEPGLTEPGGVPALRAGCEPRLDDDGYWAARQALGAAGVPFVEARLARDEDDATAAAAAIGYPVALKVMGLLHKSDVGGVALGLADEAALRAAFHDMTARLAPPGFSVEHMAPTGAGVEVIVGCRRDDRFGPLLLVGSGGLYAELLGDVRTALGPVGEDEAERLLRELRLAPLLLGARGRPALDLAAAAGAAAALSRFATAHPEVAEVEVNPLLVSVDGVVGLDARLVLRGGDDSAEGET